MQDDPSPSLPVDFAAAAPDGWAPDGAAPGKPLTEAARRALQEAAERRHAEAQAAAAGGERGGPRGLEPTRYGDWERKGLAVDF